ncbi:MAG: D-amino acid dehydrogenase [Gammaproteobacteria bacterium]|nr:D-amino acid dehydrogenase [Gammaproteobacteria bacterium]
MKIVVLGGGVVGVASAYHLAEDGHEVTLVDRNPLPASETSLANAGLVTPGDSYAWASPEALKIFLESLFREDLGIKMRLRPDPALWSWSLRFLRECTRARTRINTLRKLRLTMYSRECMAALVERTGIDYDATRRGVLYFFRSQESLDRGVAHMQLLADNGLDIEVVDGEGMTKLDPGLARAKTRLAGAVYSPMDHTGDCAKFSRALAEWIREHRGVQLACNRTVIEIETRGNRIVRVLTDHGPLEAHAYVLAAGCDSPALARPLGVKLPIYPVKGYSITMPVRDDAAAPQLGGVDEDKLVAYSRLGDRIRMAATAEFAGNDRSHRPEDFRTILATADELFPGGGDYDRIEYWAGLRPMTPSSVPVHGRAGYANLYLNVGHGHVGWTMACGSGKLVADLVAGRAPDIDPEGLLYAA